MRTMRALFSRAVIALLLASSVSTAQSDGSKLRYGFQRGKAYKYRTSLEVFSTSSTSAKEGSRKPVLRMFIGVSLSALPGETSNDQRWKFVADTVGVRMEMPGEGGRDISFEQLKGKSMELLTDDRGVARSVRDVDQSVLGQTKDFGFEIFSRDLLYIMLAFPEFPENSIEQNQSWRYLSSDTVSRGGQKVIVSRETECQLVGSVTVGNRLCRKIAYTVLTRFHGQNSNGETTAAGSLLCTEQGIPIKSEATIKAVLKAGGAQTVQQRTVRTVLQ